jgi:hypothetical protein
VRGPSATRLKGVHESNPGRQSWAEATQQALIEGRDALTEQQMSLISSYYAGAIAAGRARTHLTATASFPAPPISSSASPPTAP